jgi:hypothetical protein
VTAIDPEGIAGDRQLDSKKELIMKHVLIGLSLVGSMLVAGGASAEDTNVITLKTMTVYGHPQRPAAAVEVSRVRMQLGATTPTLARAAKIHDAAKKDPF